jgi:hypothetical protein
LVSQSTSAIDLLLRRDLVEGIGRQYIFLFRMMCQLRYTFLLPFCEHLLFGPGRGTTHSIYLLLINLFNDVAFGSGFSIDPITGIFKIVIKALMSL